jgi:nucleotide-binding universal stress UspA family protein
MGINATEKSTASIIVGVDGSEPARLAMNMAINLARRFNARLFIITICSLPSSPLLRGVPAYPHTITHFADFSPKVPEEFFGRLEPVLIEYEEKAKKADVKYVKHKIIPVWDTVGAGLVKEAEAQGCFVIILGSRGLTGIKRSLLGSVADYVVKHAPCDVMIIRS